MLFKTSSMQACNSLILPLTGRLSSVLMTLQKNSPPWQQMLLDMNLNWGNACSSYMLFSIQRHLTKSITSFCIFPYFTPVRLSICLSGSVTVWGQPWHFKTLNLYQHLSAPWSASVFSCVLKRIKRKYNFTYSVCLCHIWMVASSFLHLWFTLFLNLTVWR